MSHRPVRMAAVRPALVRERVRRCAHRGHGAMLTCGASARSSGGLIRTRGLLPGTGANAHTHTIALYQGHVCCAAARNDALASPMPRQLLTGLNMSLHRCPSSPYRPPLTGSLALVYICTTSASNCADMASGNKRMHTAHAHARTHIHTFQRSYTYTYAGRLDVPACVCFCLCAVHICKCI
jgi:hypothetical protein